MYVREIPFFIKRYQEPINLLKGVLFQSIMLHNSWQAEPTVVKRCWERKAFRILGLGERKGRWGMEQDFHWDHLSENLLTICIKTMKNLRRDGQKHDYVTFLSMSCISNVFVEFLLPWHSQIWVWMVKDKMVLQEFHFARMLRARARQVNKWCHGHA